MSINPASGSAPVPGGGGMTSGGSGSGSDQLSALRQLATTIGRLGSTAAPNTPRLTKGIVVAVDGNIPTQSLSINIDGDVSTRIDNVTFLDSYHCPAVGDVVSVIRQGGDTLVLDRYVQGGGLIARFLLGADSALNITVPSNYNHLLIYVVGSSVSNPAGGFDDLTLQFNGDSGAHYSRHFHYSLNGGSWTLANADATTFITGGFLQANSAPGSGGGYTVIDIPLYNRASLSKQITFRSHASSGVGAPNNKQYGVGGGIWGNGTAAITSILLGTATSPGTLKAGSEVYVYGV